MTQILPSDDLFTEEATHYGNYLTGGYMRMNPWITAGESVTGYTITNPTVSWLHSGYTAGASTRAAFSTGISAATTAHLCCSEWRAYYAQNATVSLRFALNVVAGTPTTDSFRYAAVFGRVSGGTFVETAASEAHIDVDGYCFLLANTSALGAKFCLLRIKAGVVAAAASSVIASFPNGIVTDLQASAVLSLTIGTSGSDPTLLAKATIAGVETTIFSVTDTHANKITAAGRFGFGACRDRQDSGVNTATTISEFVIYDTGSSTYKLVDNFYRGSALNVGAAFSDANAKSGRILSTAFRGDVHGTIARSIQREATANRVYTNVAVIPNACISSRPANSLVDHHRSAVFRVNNTNGPSGATATWGLMLRGSVTSTGFFANGYLFLLTNTLGDTNASLYVSGPTGAISILCLANAVSGVTLNAEHTLEMHVYNSLSGGTVIKCFIGGVAVPWTDPVAGVSIDGDSVVRYTASGAPSSGDAEGFFIQAHASGPSVVRADTWTQLAPNEDATDPDNQVGIVMSSETTGATGTFTVPYDWDVACEEIEYVAEHPYDSDHKNVISMGARPRRTWTISANLTASEIATARAFFASHGGRWFPFTFEHEDYQSVTARFLDDNFTDSIKDVGVHHYQARVEEMIA